MTKAKAIEVLNIGYSGCVRFRETLRDEPDDFDSLNDLMIALLTAIDALEQNNGWISVKDRLPDDEKRYLICGLHGRIDIAYYQPIGDKFSNHEPFWQGSNCRFTVVTHWQPLPEPPESAEIMEAIAGGETSDRAERRPR